MLPLFQLHLSIHIIKRIESLKKVTTEARAQPAMYVGTLLTFFSGPFPFEYE
jgi:hypothetical protein